MKQFIKKHEAFLFGACFFLLVACIASAFLFVGIAKAFNLSDEEREIFMIALSFFMCFSILFPIQITGIITNEK